MFYFPPHPKSVCALPGKTEPTKYCLFTHAELLLNLNNAQNMFC